MMALDHENLVRIAKSWGLFYMLAMAVGVMIYAYRPRNKTKFDEAGRSILDKDDKPWR